MLGKTLKEVDDMDASEVLLWQGYLSEPRGEDRADYNAAQICHAVYTFLLSWGGSKTKLKLEDNLLEFGKYQTDEEKSEEATLKNISIMNGMFGAVATELVDKLKSVENKE